MKIFDTVFKLKLITYSKCHKLSSRVCYHVWALFAYETFHSFRHCFHEINVSYFSIFWLSFCYCTLIAANVRDLKDNLGPGTKDLGPKTQVWRAGIQDSKPQTQNPELGTPKSGTLRLWNFLLNFKIKRWKVRNHLQVKVIMQSISLHIFSS